MLTISILLLTIGCQLINAKPFSERDQVNKSAYFTFTSTSSYANFYTERRNHEEIMQISFQFETRRITGQLLTVPLVYSNGEEKFVLTLFIKNGFIHARFGPEKDHRKIHWTFGADVSDGKTHKTSITVKPSEKTISLTIDKENKLYSYRHYDPLTNVDRETSLIFGYSGKETGHIDVGFVGCVWDVVLKSGDKYFHLEQTINVTGHLSGCSDACTKNMCTQKTDCVNYHSHYKCDCYKSGKEGVQCSKDLTVVSLDGTKTVQYDLREDDNDLRIRRIGLGFKTFVKQEQILFDGPLNNMIGSHGRFFVALTKSEKIVFIINDVENLYEIGTENFADGNWHFVTIEINLPTKSLDVKVDHFGWMSIEMKSVDLNFHYKDTVLTFGGASKDELKGRNFMGCLKELYINYKSVLPIVKQQQSKNTNGPKLTFGCTRNQIVHQDESGTIFYANQVDNEEHHEHPAVDDEIKETHIGADEQENKETHTGAEEEDNIAVEPSLTESAEADPTESVEPEDTTVETPVEPVMHEAVPPVLGPLPEEIAGTASEAQPETSVATEIVELHAESTVAPEEPTPTEAKESSGWLDFFGSTDDNDKKSEMGVMPGQMNIDIQPTEEPVTPRPRITCDDLVCSNSAPCADADGKEDARCVCRDGFAGETCLFSTLPRSCDELFNMGERRNGVYKIDPVGGETPNQAHVNCIMDTTMGITVVGHNFPNMTQVRNKSMTDINFYITYKFVNQDGLKHLIDGSVACQQHIRYNCVQAPLQFMRSFTFFESAKISDPFARIGDDKGRCPCAAGLQNNCIGHSISVNNTCNCDSSNTTELFDEGIMKDDLGAITKMTFLQFPDRDSVGKMTLSDLTCGGSKGYDDVVQFKSSLVSLNLPTWKGRSLSFWFRTSSGDNLLLSQPSTGSQKLKMSVKQAHMLDVKFNFGGADSRVEVISQKPINDSKWHKVVVEHIKNYVRFSLDDQHSFYKLTSDKHLDDKTFNEPLVLGFSPLHQTISGFVGCIRQVIVDGSVINLNKLKQDQNIDDTKIITGCQDQCSVNPCRNNAECVEDYENVKFKCQCVNPRVHLGPDCSEDINENSDISFHNPTTSFVNLTNIKNNPVIQDIVFSFKTDQADALLLYAHDQDYNFIQVHLWGGNKITLTANFQTKLHQCTISRPDKDFDTMEWVQILIDYEPDYLALYADKLFCRIEGHRILADGYVETWDNPNDVQDVVVPPRSPFKPKDPSAVDVNTVLFMGGVPNLGIIGRRTKRQSYYQTYLPNLLGGIRGLRVGDETLNLQNTGVKPQDNSVKVGSNFGCKELNCQHGGMCTVAWGTRDEKASCDCCVTSYAGPSCADDNGVTFDGHTYVSFDMKEYLSTQYLPADRSYDDVRFAFSSTGAPPPPPTEDPTSTSHTQVLVDMKFLDGSEIKLTLNTQKGHLHLAVTDISQGGTQGQDVGGSYADGTRHFVYMKFSRSKILIRVDQQHVDIVCRLNLENLKSVSFGGGAGVEGNEKNQNYTGCMSNAVVEFHSTKRIVTVSPLIYATDSTQRLASYTTVVPSTTTLATSPCASFKVVPPTDTTATIVVMPDWNVPLKTDVYIRPISPTGPAGDEGGNYGVAIGLIILLIILLIIVGLFLYYKKCRKRNDPKPPQPNPEDPHGQVIDPEKKPFLPNEPHHPATVGQTGRGHSRDGKINPSQGELPDADEDLDKFADRGYHHDPRAKIVDDVFPPPPTAEEIRAMTPTVPHKSPHTPFKGTFTYGPLPYVDENPSRKSSDNTDKVAIVTRQPSIRRQPKAVDIPKV